MPDLQPDSTASVSRLDRRYRPALMSFFLRRLHDRAEAEDLTQEVLTRLAGGGAVELRRPDAYVFQVAANLLRDRRRREQVRADYRSQIEAQALERAEMLGPERVVAGRQALGQVLAALQELPERTRAIFVLHRLEKLRKHEIAELFGLSVSGIDKQLLKAMTHLHQRLREET